MLNKKTISPVVATALLLVVAVGAVVSFQGWFNTYSSSLFVNTEQQSKGSLNTKIENVIGNSLYFKNGNSINLTIDLVKINNLDCGISTVLIPGMNELNITSCARNLTSTSEAVVYTNNGIYSKKFYVNTVGEIFSISCFTDLDIDGFISPTCALYPMLNLSFEGHLDILDSNSTIHPDLNCIFDDYKNSASCLNNFIIDGCGTGTVLDISTGLCWQRGMSTSGTLNWTNAINYCDTLSLGGNSDWRLPSSIELISIADFSRSNPAIVGGNNNKFQNVLSTRYWTYTQSSASVTSSWFVDFFYGSVVVGSTKNTLLNVVCVRNQQ